METNLVLIHIAYVIALVYLVFRSGEKNGRKQMVEDFIDRGITTEKKLEKIYRGSFKPKHK